ncbi:MAG: hypothetical protein GOVbin568_6 [Prokaryotic dsDNA virus sp.]|nr:MAG: hypothetical protein GOVbin568_6 [Prokaryotic dsDNA virus sp.]|tara:strand:- start:1974 stop:2243 length:270 start_codon:yes stop_codon:yes gene_type:complete
MSYPLKNNNDLLFEQLGKKGDCIVFTTAAQTSKDFYAVHFVTESVVSAIAIDNCTGETALQTTIPAGTVLLANVTAITMTSGVAIGYNN